MNNFQIGNAENHFLRYFSNWLKPKRGIESYNFVCFGIYGFDRNDRNLRVCAVTGYRKGDGEPPHQETERI